MLKSLKGVRIVIDCSLFISQREIFKVIKETATNIVTSFSLVGYRMYKQGPPHLGASFNRCFSVLAGHSVWFHHSRRLCPYTMGVM